MEYFETHAHYDDERFNNDREQIIDSLKKEGVTTCINVGCSIETSKESVELANKYDFIYAACGIHPSEIAMTSEQLKKDVEEIKRLSKMTKKTVAIGEIGLDYHWNKENKEEQKNAFIAQIELANELKLPIIIHTRDAVDDTIEILRKVKVENGGVLHCCPFNKELVKHGLERGFYIAFGGTSTFKNSKNADEIIRMVPLEKMLIETDSPYLAPEPVRGTRNDSRNLKYIVKKLADVKEILPEEMSEITYKNAKTLFKII
jgi:TatD DNase family protein